MTSTRVRSTHAVVALLGLALAACGAGNGGKASSAAGAEAPRGDVGSNGNAPTQASDAGPAAGAASANDVCPGYCARKLDCGVDDGVDDINADNCPGKCAVMLKDADRAAVIACVSKKPAPTQGAFDPVCAQASACAVDCVSLCAVADRCKSVVELDDRDHKGCLPACQSLALDAENRAPLQCMAKAKTCDDALVCTGSPGSARQAQPRAQAPADTTSHAGQSACKKACLHAEATCRGKRHDCAQTRMACVQSCP